MQEQTSNSRDQFVSGRLTPREREAIVQRAVHDAAEQVSRQIVDEIRVGFSVYGGDPRGRAM